ncbi:hypothetical protein C5Z25_06115 [Lactobacillus sp. CBA3605]|uniref:ATP-binding protein n=1 Tax=Lactobacillus sp. CBA3605 TaxID=2099788 RepID=UPI000CFD0886|nr:AAA family ATPase [Lactobacillus sp. CBA3605]AVK61368.1 hypothetical protein C5Z25_06115 [Lactobacillus sp. CBA3605]
MAWDSKKAEVELTKWFTPSKPATRNYVDRGALDKTIFREFSQQGRQVLVFGPTGAGKTSMVLDNLNKLQALYQTNSVRVTMTNTTTVESFLSDIALKMNLTRKGQQVSTTEAGHDTVLGLAKWVALRSSQQIKNTQQVVDEQYTGTDDFAILEEALFKRNTVLVVDDMENLSADAKNLRIRLAEIAKNMSDDAVNYEDSYAKIIFVGIAQTAEELWRDVQSLRSRLATISVPYLNQQESNQIIRTGWDKANLNSSEEQIKRTTYISSGIGKVVHELGQKTGYAAVDENNQKIEDRYINDAIHEIFEVNELTFEFLLDKAKNKTSTKTTVRNYILYAMANDDRTTMTMQDILKAVNELRHDDKKGANSISPALTQLKSDEFGILTSEDRNSWHFTDPMFKAYVREHKDALLLKK